MKIKASNFALDFIPENAEDIELTEKLFSSILEGSSEYLDFELSDDKVLTFGLS